MATDAADDTVTINQGPMMPGSASTFDGETLIVNGGSHTGNLIYNGESVVPAARTA